MSDPILKIRGSLSILTMEGRCSTNAGFEVGSSSFLDRRLAWFDPRALINVRNAVSCVAVQQQQHHQEGHPKHQQPWSQPKQRKHPASTVHVSFVGCVRNAEASLPRRMAQTEALGASFADYSALVWEDGSKDATRMLLRAWADSNPRVRLLLATGTWPGGAVGRLARLGFCRNVLLAETLKGAAASLSTTAGSNRPRQGSGTNRSRLLHAQGAISLPRTARVGRHTERVAETREHVTIVLDFDCPARLEWPQLARAVGIVTQRSHGWDVLTANSLPSYYDLFALRSERLGIEYNCLESSPTVFARGLCIEYEVVLDPQAGIIQVDSAFNGMAIYHTASLLAAQCNYGGALIRICEHVGFHLCLRRKGLRIGIAPFLVDGCGGEHAHPEWPKVNHLALYANGTLTSSLQHTPHPMSLLGELHYHLRQYMVTHLISNGCLTPAALALLLLTCLGACTLLCWCRRWGTAFGAQSRAPAQRYGWVGSVAH